MDNAPPETLGDREIFNLPKTGFLCSRKVPAAAVLKICEWAGKMREHNICVMSGFHTALECDVWKILAGGNSPLVWVCARGLPKRPSAEVRRALDGGRLLVLAPFAGNRPTQKTSHLRNLFVLENAAETAVGYATPGGRLTAALDESNTTATYLHGG